MMKERKLRERAGTAVRESKHLVFNPRFDAESEGDWCELTRDLVALANSGGGIILFGLERDATPSGFDPAGVLALDTASIAEKIFRCSGVRFSGVEVISVERVGGWFAGMLVQGSMAPLPFAKAGTYASRDGSLKTAFAKGAVYFRHGAKSEAGNSQDFVAWRDREVARVRSEWMSGFRKVVSAPPGYAVTLLPSPTGSVSAIVHGQISEVGKRQAVAVTNAEEIWPYRQKDLLREVNRMIRPQRMTSYDVQCANRKFDVKNRSNLRYKSHHLAAPQYSKAYVELLVESARSDPHFVEKLREEFRPVRVTDPSFTANR